MNMSETIRIPDMSIDENRIRRKIIMLGINALFTNIKDLFSMDIIDMKKKQSCTLFQNNKHNGYNFTCISLDSAEDKVLHFSFH